MSIRIGQGWDSHAFKTGVPLKIGGISIEHHEGLAGHSDGDVLLHARLRMPCLARSRPAISAHFFSAGRSTLEGCRLGNLSEPGHRRDTERRLSHHQSRYEPWCLAAPKISPIAVDIRERIADMLDLDLNAVSVKAKTPEGMNLDHVAQAHAIVLIEKVEEPGQPQNHVRRHRRSGTD